MFIGELRLAGLLTALCAYEVKWIAQRYGMRESELKLIRDAVRGPFPTKRGEVLFHQGDSSDWIYAAASGTFKATATDKQWPRDGFGSVF